MTQQKTETLWLEGMAFENNLDGHKIIVDAVEEFGGTNKGPTPKPLLLNSLSGCTGMDVVSILKKMKQEFTWFNIVVEADLGEEHPKTFENIRLTYQFKTSDNLDDTKVRKAVSLSQDRYCGVSAMLKKACNLSWEIEYLD
ncbi:MAG: OsmC family protein [Spirochaetaceae bacterium]|nr:OsmC family protein [Spirochaetaceae bacterium]